MGTYTSEITYLKVEPNLLNEAVRVKSFDDSVPVAVEPCSEIYLRAHENFTQDKYLRHDRPINLGELKIDDFVDLYVLRLLIKAPDTDHIIPTILNPIMPLIRKACVYQKAYFPVYNERFVYVTVRAGTVKSMKDDTFHVDGFQGLSIPRHIPEQSYFWCDKWGTEFADQGYDIRNLDPTAHNVHQYFNRKTNPANVWQTKSESMYLFDPYQVHRRVNIPEGSKRVFVRITFSPVEIRDDTNTINPSLIRGPYNRSDIRNKLVPFAD